MLRKKTPKKRVAVYDDYTDPPQPSPMSEAVSKAALHVEPLAVSSPVLRKLAKAEARMPLSQMEQLVLARLAIRAIAEGARSDLREIAQAAAKVIG